MGDGIYAALSGAIAHQTSLETTATNLSNASTAGFRAIRPVFQEVLAREEGPGQPVRFSTVSRARMRRSVRRMSQPCETERSPGSQLSVSA